MANSPFIVFHVPKDPTVLQALGVVTIRQGHLDRALRMTIKTLAGLTAREAIETTVRKSSSYLRDRVGKLAKQALGGNALLRLQVLLDRAEAATEKRNRLVHSVCAREADGTDPQLHADDHTLAPYPTAAELTELAEELGGIANELNQARLSGFIALALAEKGENVSRLGSTRLEIARPERF